MSKKTSTLVALDVGEKRIGVARAATDVPIAVPLTTVLVDGQEVVQILDILRREYADELVVGYPRNQSGEATAQTAFVEAFMARLDSPVPVRYQDESLTSVMAEQRLKAAGRPYSKGDIDAQAATIILQDYMETHYATR